MAEYLEREATIASIENVLRGRTDEKGSPAYLAFSMFAELIKIAPAADVVEVKHGEWIESDYCLAFIYQCSVCKEDFEFIEGTPEENHWKYCPNCGAKMDVKEGAEE